jgi:hypothetical protein
VGNKKLQIHQSFYNMRQILIKESNYANLLTPNQHKIDTQHANTFSHKDFWLRTRLSHAVCKKNDQFCVKLRTRSDSLRTYSCWQIIIRSNVIWRLQENVKKKKQTNKQAKTTCSPSKFFETHITSKTLYISCLNLQGSHRTHKNIG